LKDLIYLLTLIAMFAIYININMNKAQINSQKNTVLLQGQFTQKYDYSTNRNKELDILAEAYLLSAESKDSSRMNFYYAKMIEKGATQVFNAYIYKSKSRIWPLQKMELNGKTLKGRKCAKVSYKYDNTLYWVGYCR